MAYFGSEGLYCYSTEGKLLWKKDLEANSQCCTKCGFHFKIGARERLEMLFDDGQYTEFDTDLASTDPLEFRDTKSYRDRLNKAEKVTGMKDALLSALKNA